MIAIKDMKMPKACCKCIFYINKINKNKDGMYALCYITRKKINPYIKSKDCPLIEVEVK